MSRSNCPASSASFDPMDGKTSWHAVGERLAPILRAAREKGAFVCFDMEQSSFKDLTIWIFKQILLEDEFRDWADCRIAIQRTCRGRRRSD